MQTTQTHVVKVEFSENRQKVSESHKRVAKDESNLQGNIADIQKQVKNHPVIYPLCLLELRYHLEISWKVRPFSSQIAFWLLLFLLQNFMHRTSKNDSICLSHFCIRKEEALQKQLKFCLTNFYDVLLNLLSTIDAEAERIEKEPFKTGLLKVFEIRILYNVTNKIL